MSKINTVIFDFDGTIADTNQLIIDSWQAVYRAYTGQDGDEKYILSTFGEPLYYSMAKTFPEYDLEETVSIYRNFQKGIFKDTIKVFPGMVNLIKALKEKGYKTGIVTARLRYSTYEGLSIFGIQNCIDEIVTVEDTEKHKPDPEPALICLERLESKAEESIMVGDSLFDIGCAKNAGMKSVMVKWSAAAQMGMESAAVQAALGDAGDGAEGDAENGAGESASLFTPDYYIETAEDLWEILRQA